MGEMRNILTFIFSCVESISQSERFHNRVPPPILQLGAVNETTRAADAPGVLESLKPGKDDT